MPYNKIITVSPSYMREIAGQLGTAEQQLNTTFQYLAKANDTSTWTCPEAGAVRSAIMDSVTNLKQMIEITHNHATYLKNTADQFGTVIAQVASREEELTRELGENSGVTAVKWGGGTALPPISLTLPKLPAASTYRPTPFDPDRVAYLPPIGDGFGAIMEWLRNGMSKPAQGGI